MLEIILFSNLSGHFKMSKSKLITSSSELWSYLKGVICLHKPSGMPVYELLEKVNQKILQDLNDLNPDYKERLKTLQNIQRQGGLIDYSCHPHVLGDAFYDEDIGKK